jgi:hypothetical protein
VSRFVADAVREALYRRQLERVLDELDRTHGPVDPDVQAQADAVFDKVEDANAALVAAVPAKEPRRRIGRGPVTQRGKRSATSESGISGKRR